MKFTELENNKRTIVTALCEGRHEMPDNVSGAVFPMTIDPTNVAELNRIATRFVKSADSKDIHLVVTGLSVALVAVIKAVIACAADNSAATSLTLWHYDRNAEDYYPQRVIDFPKICPFCGHIMSTNEWYCGACGST